ncbi:Na+/H+ antiporter subunit E [candidate division WOR-3 bacterium]|nr:Na+/H+ antiporter subunit E [candidate division WOR-3 bacterium]
MIAETTSGSRLKSFLWLFFILLIVWLLLTATFNYQEFWVGVAAALLIALFTNEFYLRLGFPPITPKRIIYFLLYIVVLFFEIIKANFDVARRVISPSLPINPGVVIIQTKLKSDIAKAVLANSITLTPGTFTIDIQEDKLLIHWIDVKATNIEQTTSAIGEKFEKYLRVIFQ